MLAEAEHFQNQFILQKEQFHMLRREINKQKSSMCRDFQETSYTVPVPVIDNQQQLKNKMQATEKIFASTKREFYRFLCNML